MHRGADLQATTGLLVVSDRKWDINGFFAAHWAVIDQLGTKSQTNNGKVFE